MTKHITVKQNAEMLWVVRVDGCVCGIFHRHQLHEAMGHARRICDGTRTDYAVLPPTTNEDQE